MFKKAIKTEAKLRLAIAGPSGSGKTYSALAIGTGLSSKVALVDTEHGSAAKYADIFNFDVLEMQAPYSPEKYITAIEAAASGGYEVLILDSMSHAWNGAGGMLEMVEQVSKKYRGNSYAAWGEVTPLYQRLIDTIVSANLHVISTMRSKQDYILVEKNGKQVPQKVGMAPIQRDGFEYEFDVFLDMDIENNGIVQKTRCPALVGQVINKPGQQLADVLQDWLHGAPALKDTHEQPDAFKIADLRSALETVESPTLGTIADYLATVKVFSSPQKALKAIGEYDFNGADVKIEMSQKVTNQGAVKVFDWLLEQQAN